ncbi:MAG: hypothetical protein MRY21_04035 [Simkaniaceae bacterium]|nr:hypothetical protein [Simkaniaceae bacterium]
MNNEDRIYVVDVFLRLVSNTLNDEYLNRVWVKCLGPEVWDCVEYAVQMMDTITILLDPSSNFKLKEAQIHACKRYYQILDDFPHIWEPPEIMLMTPEWQEVQKAGQGVLDTFNYPLKDV